MGTGVSVAMSVSVGAAGVGTSAISGGSAVEGPVTEAGVEVGRMGAMLCCRKGGNWEGSMAGIGGMGGSEVRAGRFKGGRDDNGGTAVVPTAGGRPLLPVNDTAPRSGSGRLRLGNSGGKPAGRGIRPGSVVAELKLVEEGFSGARGVREGGVDEGSSGTVGKPVCSSLGMLGAEVLMDRPERESSRPEETDNAVGGGVTADSWTSVNPSFSGLMGSLGGPPGKLIFFPSSNGLVGIL